MAKMTEAERRKKSADRKAVQKATLWDTPLSDYELNFVKERFAEDRAKITRVQEVLASLRFHEIEAVHVFRRRGMAWSDIEEATGISRIALHRRLVEYRKSIQFEPGESSSG